MDDEPLLMKKERIETKIKEVWRSRKSTRLGANLG